MIETETIKKYFWSALGTAGIVFFWAGVWDGIGYLPYLKSPWVSLVIGVVILATSGILYSEKKEKTDEIKEILRKIYRNPIAKEFKLKYQDKISHHEIIIPLNKIQKIEKDYLLVEGKEKKELFIPLHRITKLIQHNEVYWENWRLLLKTKRELLR